MTVPPSDQPIELEPGTPLAEAIERCLAAVDRKDASEIDTAYDEAVAIAATNDLVAWVELARDHATALLDVGSLDAARKRCTVYLSQPGGDVLGLRLVRAEIYVACGCWEAALADTTAIGLRSGAGPSDRGERLSAQDMARLFLVEGLVEISRGDLDRGDALLTMAWREFRAAGQTSAVADVERQRLTAAALRGDQRAITAIMLGMSPETTADYLLIAKMLRRRCHYQRAIGVILLAVTKDPDPATHLGLMAELVLLAGELRDGPLSRRWEGWLRRLAADSPDPTAAAALVERLTSSDLSTVPPELSTVPPRTFGAQLRRARQLADAGWFEESGALIASLEPRAQTALDTAMWHLAAGELAWEASERSDSRWDSALDLAVDHLSQAVDHASANSLVEVLADALHPLGRALFARGETLAAQECWLAAQDLEERVAMLQPDATVCARMLHSVQTEHDECVEAAASLIDQSGLRTSARSAERHRLRASARSAERHRLRAAAAVVAAMEAGKGTGALRQILPDVEVAFARVPGPLDLAGATGWVARIGRRLPRSQVVWMMHATPRAIHHAIVGSRLIYLRTAVNRDMLLETITKLRGCWVDEGNDAPGANEAAIRRAIENGTFEEYLGRLAAMIGVEQVLESLPERTRRVAIVASGELSDIPFAALPVAGQAGRRLAGSAALPVAGQATRLGLLLALSDLPCLSAAAPLRRRARRIRSGGSLLVQPDAKLTASKVGCGSTTRSDRTVLSLAAATPDRLRLELQRRRYGTVRLDTHGRFADPTGVGPCVQLAPGGPPGLLSCRDLESLELSGCGLLILGACESGMAERVGLDQRLGFVRSAFQAGVPSAIAARWAAKDEVAANVLDRYEGYVRDVPKDVALQRALLDLHAGVCAVPDVPHLDHPAYWACWTLYGDPGSHPGACFPFALIRLGRRLSRRKRS